MSEASQSFEGPSLAGLLIHCWHPRFLVVEKPSGLLSQPGLGDAQSDSLITRVQAVRPELRLVHRLDRDTSGLLLLARDPDELESAWRLVCRTQSAQVVCSRRAWSSHRTFRVGALAIGAFVCPPTPLWASPGWSLLLDLVALRAAGIRPLTPLARSSNRPFPSIAGAFGSDWLTRHRRSDLCSIWAGLPS